VGVIRWELSSGVDYYTSYQFVKLLRLQSIKIHVSRYPLLLSACRLWS
jgi:hypothetical protein